ncbi:MAG: RNA polymerase sigma factor [Planctomycetes bacterium]|nr:RNA polymerase sigma factor [Planctomycetota bacterium]
MAAMEFPTTLWTTIRNAGRQDPPAANRVVQRYRPAVVGFLRQHGFSEADSEDLAQDVLLRLFGEDILARAEQARGRFRTLLIAVTKQVMYDEWRRRSARKRGGGAKRVDLEQAPEPEIRMTDPVEDEQFDRGWATNLMSLALDRLREECEGTGRAYHQALRMHLEGASYAQIAGVLATSLTNVSTWIRRAKLRVRHYVDDEVRTYCSSPEEYRHDAPYVARLLGQGP